MLIRRFLVLVLLVVAAVPSLALSAPAHQSSAFLQAQGRDLVWNGRTVILKGSNFDNINALGANIGSNNVNDITFSDADYAEMARQGGNHVRLGLSFSWYQQNKAAFFAAMDRQVGFARKHGIFLVFNMFTTPGNCYEGYSNHCGFWGSTAEQQQLQSFWVEMATRYKSEPAVAGYDLLNEPTPPTDCKPWFRIAQTIRDAVYAVSPNQLVFVNTCSDPGNDLKYNNPPKGANIVYEVHNYAPMDMTHDMFSPGSVYPGTANEWFGSCYVDKNVMATGQGCPELNIREQYGMNWAAQNNVPIYVGEWGAASVLKGYVQYTRDVAELFQEWGVNHAHYTWRHQTIKTGGFYQWGIYSTNPSVADDPAKLEALKIAFAGAVRPNFESGSVTVVPTTIPATNTPAVTNTAATSTATRTATVTRTPNQTQVGRTATAVARTATAQAASPTSVPATATALPATAIPPSATPGAASSFGFTVADGKIVITSNQSGILRLMTSHRVTVLPANCTGYLEGRSIECWNALPGTVSIDVPIGLRWVTVAQNESIQLWVSP